MTKARLAADAKLARAPISRYERKQTKNLSARSLAKLSQALGVSADYLAGRSDDEAFFLNPHLRKLMKDLSCLEPRCLKCLHQLYLFLLDKQR